MGARGKGFPLHKELPLVAMTAGLGQFGPASVSNLAKDLRIELSRTGGDPLDKATYTVEETAERARGFLKPGILNSIHGLLTPIHLSFGLVDMGLTTRVAKSGNWR